jgi:hypothetical protein
MLGLAAVGVNEIFDSSMGEDYEVAPGSREVEVMVPAVEVAAAYTCRCSRCARHQRRTCELKEVRPDAIDNLVFA